jgi:FAD/FMN-containing dehydrogenase
VAAGYARRPAHRLGTGCLGSHPTVLDWRDYVNFQLAEDDTARTADAYGKDFERLQRVKAEYDPDNLFRVNRNIPPA